MIRRRRRTSRTRSRSSTMQNKVAEQQIILHAQPHLTSPRPDRMGAPALCPSASTNSRSCGALRSRKRLHASWLRATVSITLGVTYVHSFQGSFLLENHQKPWRNSWCLKRTMAEKNGESTPRITHFRSSGSLHKKGPGKLHVHAELSNALLINHQGSSGLWAHSLLQSFRQSWLIGALLHALRSQKWQRLAQFHMPPKSQLRVELVSKYPQ